MEQSSQAWYWYPQTLTREERHILNHTEGGADARIGRVWERLRNYEKCCWGNGFSRPMSFLSPILISLKIVKSSFLEYYHNPGPSSSYYTLSHVMAFVLGLIIAPSTIMQFRQLLGTLHSEDSLPCKCFYKPSFCNFNTIQGNQVWPNQTKNNSRIF